MAIKNIKELVKDPEWQKVRESLLGKWKSDESWCLQQLKNYLGDIHSTDIKKLYIVLNYLMGSAFRSGKLKSSEIQKLRTQISVEIKIRKMK